jgi:hypothetical protein
MPTVGGVASYEAVLPTPQVAPAPVMQTPTVPWPSRPAVTTPLPPAHPAAYPTTNIQPTQLPPVQ